jgi:hypothetical protein
MNDEPSLPRFMVRQGTHVVWDRVCNGPAIFNDHQAIRLTMESEPDQEPAQEILRRVAPFDLDQRGGVPFALALDVIAEHSRKLRC